MRFEYWHSSDGCWTWHLITSIGDILAHGTPFTTRENCLAAIKLVRLAAGSRCQDASAPAHEIPAPGGATLHLAALH